MAGDFEISCFASGILRMRLILEQSQPDYGILDSESKHLSLEVRTITDGYHVQAGNIALEILSGPMRLRFFRDETMLLESVTDRTIEGHLRFSPFAKRVRLVAGGTCSG